jgi:hypothetical protein
MAVTHNNDAGFRRRLLQVAQDREGHLGAQIQQENFGFAAG